MEDRFKCPCGEIISVPEDTAGRTISCKQCGRELVVPRVPVASVAASYDNYKDFEELEEAMESQPSASPNTDQPSSPVCVAEQPLPRTQPAQQRQMPPGGPVSGLAVASLVLGLVGPFLGILLSMLAGLLAIIFGGFSLKSISRTPLLRGKGMATAGLILGFISLLLGGLMFATIISNQPPNDPLNVFNVIYNMTVHFR